MIDKKLYCETFSRLHASEEAKKEVFQMTKKKGARIPKLLRGAAIAAAMTMALAVTAGAVNIAGWRQTSAKSSCALPGGGEPSRWKLCQRQRYSMLPFRVSSFNR